MDDAEAVQFPRLLFGGAELIIDEIGVALRFAPATVTKATGTSAAEGDETAV